MFLFVFFLGHFLECPFFYSQQSSSQALFIFLVIAAIAWWGAPKKYLYIAFIAFVAAFVSLLHFVLLASGYRAFLNHLPFLFVTNANLAHFGIYAQKNLLAAFLLLGLFLMVQWLEETRQSYKKAFIPLAFMASVILLTDSRAALLGLMFGWLAFMYARYKKQMSQKLPLLVLAAIVVGWGLTYLYGGTNSIAEFSAKTMQGSSGVFARLIYWWAAVLVGWDHFWTGTGFGGLKEVYGDYLYQAAQMLHLPSETFSQTLWPHNDFLHIFAEFGFPVFVVYCAFCGYLLWACYRKGYYALASALLAFYVMMFFSHPLRLPMLALTFFLLAAYVLYDEMAPWARRRGVRLLYYTAVLAFGVWLTPQLNHMVQAKRFVDAYRQGQIASAARFQDWADRIDFQAVGQAAMGGWRFQHGFYTHVAPDIQFDGFDRDYAARVLPYAQAYSARNAFYTMDYALAQLYYVVGDYKKAMDYSWQAFEKKPDKDKYYAFHHVCHVLYKCRQSDRSVIDVLGAERVVEYINNNLFHPSQFDSRWHVL